MMRVAIVVGIGNNREIGCNNKLLWHVSADLQNFKALTMGHHIVMGRKTFESIGRPLPGRHSIILTRNTDYPAPAGCLVKHSLAEAIEQASSQGDSDLFVIGGGEIYSAALEIAERIYLSRIDYEGPADTFFPPFEHLGWQLTQETCYPSIALQPMWLYQIWDRAMP